jgi:hypothetical protein
MGLALLEVLIKERQNRNLASRSYATREAALLAKSLSQKTIVL